MNFLIIISCFGTEAVWRQYQSREDVVAGLDYWTKRMNWPLRIEEEKL